MPNTQREDHHQECLKTLWNASLLFLQNKRERYLSRPEHGKKQQTRAEKSFLSRQATPSAEGGLKLFQSYEVQSYGAGIGLRSKCLFGVGGTLIFFLILFNYSCLHFPPNDSPPPQSSPPPTLNPTPLWFCPCVLYTCSLLPFLRFPPLSPLPSPLATVSLFFISMSLLVFCLLVSFVD